MKLHEGPLHFVEHSKLMADAIKTVSKPRKGDVTVLLTLLMGDKRVRSFDQVYDKITPWLVRGEAPPKVRARLCKAALKVLDPAIRWLGELAAFKVSKGDASTKLVGELMGLPDPEAARRAICTATSLRMALVMNGTYWWALSLEATWIDERQVATFMKKLQRQSVAVSDAVDAANKVASGPNLGALDQLMKEE